MDIHSEMSLEASSVGQLLLIYGFPMTVTGKVQKFVMREQAIEELGLEG